MQIITYNSRQQSSISTNHLTILDLWRRRQRAVPNQKSHRRKRRSVVQRALLDPWEGWLSKPVPSSKLKKKNGKNPDFVTDELLYILHWKSRFRRYWQSREHGIQVLRNYSFQEVSDFLFHLEQCSTWCPLNSQCKALRCQHGTATHCLCIMFQGANPSGRIMWGSE